MKWIVGSLAVALSIAGVTKFAFGVAVTDGEAGIRKVVAVYVRSIDAADASLASTVWARTPEVSFIHPLGRERGWESIKTNFYEQAMGQSYSERKLTIKDLEAHAYGDAGWAEFNWEFVGRLRRDGSTETARGRETQVYRRAGRSWRLVHVHYSEMPATQDRSKE